MKIHPMEAKLFHADRRTDNGTDTTKLTVAFRNFAEASDKTSVTTELFRNVD